MGKLKPQSTFQKLCLAFVLLGVLPLVLVSLLFLRRYEASARLTMDNNMAEANYYAYSKVADLIGTVDRAAGDLYDYSSDPYSALYEILEDDGLSNNERQMYIGLMLDQLIKASPAVSAAYFVTPEGEVFARFYGQQKSLRTDPVGHSLPDFLDSSRRRQLFILPSVSESEWCSGSEDTVLPLARSYMDTRSLRTVTTVSLGVLYVDLRTGALDELLSSLRLGEAGNAALVDGHSGQVLYQLYAGAPVPVEQPLGHSEGRFVSGGFTVYHQPIGSSDYQLVLSFDRQELYSTHAANRTYLFFMLTAAALLVMVLGLGFSGRLSNPARKLQQAMEAVQGGDLTTRVDIHSGDEMEHLADGFNRMVEELGETIQEVYVAQICQRDAELNALKMQIRPHYLYNTLDIIRMSALETGDSRTARLIESLSRQLRYLMGGHQDRVRLRQELDDIREYAVLVEARYEGRIQINIEAADSDLDLLVPKLLLQPFVENAVKHGLRDRPQGGTVLIEAMRLPDALLITVLDDGAPIEPDRLEHIRRFLSTAAVGEQDGAGIVSVGMKNTSDRIKLNCGPTYGFTLDSDEAMGVIVTIRLPIWEEENGHVEGTAV